MEELDEVKDYPFSTFKEFSDAYYVFLSTDMYFYTLPTLGDKINSYIDEQTAMKCIIEELTIYDNDYDNAINLIIETVIKTNNLCEEYIETTDSIIETLVKLGGKINNYHFIKYNYDKPKSGVDFSDEIENYEIRGKLIDICYKYGLDLSLMIDWKDIPAKNWKDINNEIIKQYGSSSNYNHYHCFSYLKFCSKALQKN